MLEKIDSKMQGKLNTVTLNDTKTITSSQSVSYGKSEFEPGNS